MFAIVETGGSQYKVEKGTTIEVNRMEGTEGSSVTLDQVLMVDTNVGTPTVPGASVTAKIVAHKRGDKIVVFKMKAKKRYQKTQGHRQELTTLEITDIKLQEQLKKLLQKKLRQRLKQRRKKKLKNKLLQKVIL